MKCLYDSRGDKPSLMPFHALRLDWLSWSRVIPLLTRRFCGIAIDLRGIDGATFASGFRDLGI